MGFAQGGENLEGFGAGQETERAKTLVEMRRANRFIGNGKRSV
jgi:hypothetical protein